LAGCRSIIAGKLACEQVLRVAACKADSPACPAAAYLQAVFFPYTESVDIGIEFNQAAFRHGVTETDIRCVFAHNIFDHPVAGEAINIGFDANANAIEILYNFISDRHINVFHAMTLLPLPISA
jgi:hypothetical protein